MSEDEWLDTLDEPEMGLEELLRREALVTRLLDELAPAIRQGDPAARARRAKLLRHRLWTEMLLRGYSPEDVRYNILSMMMEETERRSDKSNEQNETP